MPLARRQAADHGDAAQTVGREVRARAGADEHDARGVFQPRGDAVTNTLEQLAGELAARSGAVDLAAGGRVEAGFVGEVVVFEDRNDEQVGVELAGRPRGQRDVRRRVGGVHRVAMSVLVETVVPGFGSSRACRPMGSGLESNEPAPGD